MSTCSCAQSLLSPKHWWHRAFTKRFIHWIQWGPSSRAASHNFPHRTTWAISTTTGTLSSWEHLSILWAWSLPMISFLISRGWGPSPSLASRILSVKDVPNASSGSLHSRTRLTVSVSSASDLNILEPSLLPSPDTNLFRKHNFLTSILACTEGQPSTMPTAVFDVHCGIPNILLPISLWNDSSCLRSFSETTQFSQP